MKCGLSLYKISTVLIIMLLLVQRGWSQSNLVFYNSDDQLNSPNLNPAFLTSQEKFTLSFFPISGISVGYNNQQVINDMILNVLQGNQSKTEFQKVFRSMLGLELFYQRMEFPLLNLGYNTDKGSFNFRIKDNMRLMTDFKGEVSDFLSDNSSLMVHMNHPQSFPIHAMYYREYSLGYARELINRRLTLGVRGKIYFGKFSLISDVIGEATYSNGDYLFSTRNQLKMSFPAKIIQDSNGNMTSATTADDFTIGKFLFNSNNPGFGFDFGFNYQVNADFSVSGSVTDVGKINWKNNLNSMDYIGEYTFDQDYIDAAKSNEQILTRTGDYPATSTNIPSLFKIKVDSSSFSTQMPRSFIAGMKYKLNSDWSVSLANRFVTAGDLNYNSFMVTGEYLLKPGLKLISGYAIHAGSYNNVPVALVYRKVKSEFFIGTDNCLSLILPGATDFSGISFGLSIFLFEDRKDGAQYLDYLPFFELKKRKFNR